MPSATQSQDLHPHIIAAFVEEAKASEIGDAADLFLEERGDVLASMQVVKEHNYPNETGDHQILTGTRMTVIAADGLTKSVKARRCIKFGLAQVTEAVADDNCPVFKIDYLDPRNTPYTLIVRRDHVADLQGNLIYTPRVDVAWTEASDLQEADRCTPEFQRNENRWNRMMAPARALAAQMETSSSMKSKVVEVIEELPVTISEPAPEDGGVLDWELHQLQLRFGVAHDRMTKVMAIAPSKVASTYLDLSRKWGALAALQALEAQAGLEPEWCRPSKLYSAQEVLGWADGSLTQLLGVWESEDQNQCTVWRCLSETSARDYTVTMTRPRGLPGQVLTVGPCDCHRKDALAGGRYKKARMLGYDRCAHQDEAEIAPSLLDALGLLDSDDARHLYLYERDQARTRLQAFERIVRATEHGTIHAKIIEARDWVARVLAKNFNEGIARGLSGTA